MPTITNLNTLKINYLTNAQYQAALENDEINENEIYLTPSDGKNNTMEPISNLTLDMIYSETSLR